MTTTTEKRSTISQRLGSLLVRRILEESVEDHKAFGRSLDELNVYLLQTEKEGCDGKRVRREGQKVVGGAGTNIWAPF
jgi:hypothetical protein